MRQWLANDSVVVWATAFGEVIGYAIAVQAKLSGRGTVSWVTQLVVHESHRQEDVGKTFLFSIWRFTDHFAWGLLSANPYAIRALEKATRRRCDPDRILTDFDRLIKLGQSAVPYLRSDTEYVVDRNASRANTKFFLDHSQLAEMLASATTEEKPWTLSHLPEGWEWLAFKFHDQSQISLTKREVREMLSASDLVTKEAYSRMALYGPWARHHDAEVDFIIRHCGLQAGNSVVDFGCGEGRHTTELARLALRATGVDYVPHFIDAARAKASEQSAVTAEFIVGDCRSVDLDSTFDAGICLYDVIGSYVSDNDNAALLGNMARHITPGGYLLISVMNMELTERLAKNWFSINSDPDKLLELKPSRIMETTGDIFDPDFYLIDSDTRLVYRKEQFTDQRGLPEKLIVRDRRYTSSEIQNLCEGLGLNVLWTRFVRSGSWDNPLEPNDPKAKEILVLCQKPDQIGQRTLFD
jgi:2-polyprenyl-3-methyl-5-hydroxy-6-metoxy-1,4-benzoquinol methylase